MTDNNWMSYDSPRIAFGTAGRIHPKLVDIGISRGVLCTVGDSRSPRENGSRMGANE